MEPKYFPIFDYYNESVLFKTDIHGLGHKDNLAAMIEGRSHYVKHIDDSGWENMKSGKSKKWTGRVRMEYVMDLNKNLKLINQ